MALSSEEITERLKPYISNEPSHWLENLERHERKWRWYKYLIRPHLKWIRFKHWIKNVIHNTTTEGE